MHSASTALLYQQIMDTRLLDWLAKSHELWSLFSYFVAGQMDMAGVISEFVTKADKASVSHLLGGNFDAAKSAPKHSLQRKLL